MINLHSLTKKHIFLATGFLITVIVIIITALITLLVVRAQQSTVKTGIPEALAPSPTPIPPDPLRPRTLAILGYAGGTHAGGSLTDTIMLVHANPRTNHVVLTSIPRDVWITLPIGPDSTLSAKVNTAYSVGLDDRKYQGKYKEYSGEGGGGSLAKQAIQTITGIYPDYFISINFNGFVSALTSLGSLEVNVPVSFTDNYYPIEGEEDNPCDKSEEQIAATTATLSGFLLEKEFPCRFESLEFTKGLTSMDPETALKFVRSRHSDIGGSDFGRALRQQAVLQAFKDKLTKAKSIPNLITALNSLHTYVSTDVPLSEIPNLLDLFPPSNKYTFSTLVLDRNNTLKESRSADRQYILVPKNDSWEDIHEFIQNFIEESQPATKSAQLNNNQDASTSATLKTNP